MTDTTQRTRRHDANAKHVDAFFQRQGEMDDRERLVGVPDAAQVSIYTEDQREEAVSRPRTPARLTNRESG